MQIEISNGEILDKLSILEIKFSNITDMSKLENVGKERLLLLHARDKIPNFPSELYDQLKTVNKEIWDIEDKIRIKEKNKKFDSEFIQLARSVYIKNDERAVIKKQININTNSDIVEEKSYEKY